MAKKDDRSRVWTFEFYPDSAPENWRQIIDSWCVPVCVSPLHQYDLNPDGTPKKAHWHGIIRFDGNKSESQILDLVAPLNGPKKVFQVNSIRSMVRYLIHLDNPDKHQYNQSDIIEFGGFEAEEYFTYASVQRSKSLKEMRDFCRDNGITEFCDFYNYCDVFRPDWSQLLDTNCCLPMRYFLQSAHFKRRDIVDGKDC